MTQYISVAQLKGGVGKTTIAYNLCGFLIEENKTVLAIDADMPQGTLSSWANLYEHENFTCTCANSVEELIEIYKQADGKFDYVITDTPPHMAEIMKATLFVSDLVLLPIAASAPDIWAVWDMLEIISNATESKGNKINLRIVWNKFKETKKANEIRADAVESFKYKEIPTIISPYVAYSEAIGVGKHALTFHHKKAKDQFYSFGQDVLTALKGK